MPRKESISVLIVDDSAVIRNALRNRLDANEDIRVIATVPDPYAARDAILHQRPDVVLLDIEMPRMDGISFLARLMERFPIPVIIVSSVTPKGSHLAMEALSLGAVDVVHKGNDARGIGEALDSLPRRVRIAAVSRPKIARTANSESHRHRERVGLALDQRSLIAIGASTGGTVAIEQVLEQLPPDCPGIVIVQHMPPVFTEAFANRLNRVVTVAVREARNGDPVEPGTALIAPGDWHMLLRTAEGRYFVELRQSPPVMRHRPSVDIQFKSVAAVAGRNAVGVLLTGMGKDGASGLLAMREAGAYTIAQDEASCVVYGMPREAVLLGAASVVKPVQNIAAEICSHFAKHSHTA